MSQSQVWDTTLKPFTIIFTFKNHSFQFYNLDERSQMTILKKKKKSAYWKGEEKNSSLLTFNDVTHT
jgi:hypothetical protein